MNFSTNMDKVAYLLKITDFCPDGLAKHLRLEFSMGREGFVRWMYGKFGGTDLQELSINTVNYWKENF